MSRRDVVLVGAAVLLALLLVWLLVEAGVSW
jgi:hypothetical protein